MQMCGDMKVDACGPAIASCSRVCGDVCVCVCVYYRCTAPYAQEMLKMFMCDAPNCSKYM